MDIMVIKSEFTRRLVGGILKKVLKKNLGIDATLGIQDLELHLDEKVEGRVCVDFFMSKEDLLKLLSKESS